MSADRRIFYVFPYSVIKYPVQKYINIYLHAFYVSQWDSGHRNVHIVSNQILIPGLSYIWAAFSPKDIYSLLKAEILWTVDSNTILQERTLPGNTFTRWHNSGSIRHNVMPCEIWYLHQLALYMKHPISVFDECCCRSSGHFSADYQEPNSSWTALGIHLIRNPLYQHHHQHHPTSLSQHSQLYILQ